MTETQRHQPVKKVPDLTPELLEESQRQQNEWAKRFVVRTTDAASYGRSVLTEGLKLLDTLERKMGEATGPDEIAAFERTIRGRRNHLATWAEAVGDFELAASLTTHDFERQRYTQAAEAVRLDDDAWCSHPHFEHVDGELQQNAYKVIDFYSPHHGTMVSLIRCGECGFMNARKLPVQLQTLEDYRARAIATGDDPVKSLKEIIGHANTR